MVFLLLRRQSVAWSNFVHLNCLYFENCELKPKGRDYWAPPLLELGCLIEDYKNKVARSILPWGAHNRVHVMNLCPVNIICWNLDILVFMKEGKPEPETSVQNYNYFLVSVMKHLFMLFHSFLLIFWSLGCWQLWWNARSEVNIPHCKTSCR